MCPACECEDVCSTQFKQLNFNGETSVMFTCSSDCNFTSSLVRGTGIYTEDSNVCAAAAHDGQNTDKPLSVTMLVGVSLYLGSTQNGINSKWRAKVGELVWKVIKKAAKWTAEELALDALVQITYSYVFGDPCVKRVDEMKFHGQKFIIFLCPKGCIAHVGRLWGSGIYTDDSYICAAAIHDGRITSTGGIVTVYKLAGMDSYIGVRRNKIDSKPKEKFKGSFAFEDMCVKQVDQINFHHKNSFQFPFACPKGCSAKKGELWGSGIYTDDRTFVLLQYMTEDSKMLTGELLLFINLMEWRRI
uniref:Uncharacterized protein LOC100181691 n=1 Tax=Phallusia mammillata TaxID=59560 RepID=A0A6F9DIE3_9ASCI|nr:uncharacterized protein LOC100181691 [Phallusia mammillata]